MKLEYLYDNNNDLKYTLKAFSIFGLVIIVLSSIMFIYLEKNVNYSFILMFAIAYTIMVISIDIVILIIITLINNYHRKRFVSIKNKGIHLEGVILTANKSYKIGQHKWLIIDSGEITVSANNKTYKITDIDYNKEFKLLKQKLEDNFYENKQSYTNLNKNFKESGILGKVQRKEITVEIYVLDNKVVADLDSIKIN